MSALRAQQVNVLRGVNHLRQRVSTHSNVTVANTTTMMEAIVYRELYCLTRSDVSVL